MARITVEDCLKQTGHENRFALIHLAMERVKQHRNGLPMLSEGKNKEIVMTLREIADGHVTKENIYDFVKKEEIEVVEEVVETVAETGPKVTAEAAIDSPVAAEASTEITAEPVAVTEPVAKPAIEVVAEQTAALEPDAATSADPVAEEASSPEEAKNE